ncbi:putative acetylornithine deacetylase protein [Lasiodiplodia theobromae]|uniref:Putative carboxypeptidase n=1 Tax=Lasiodiplodia theobromae TaxID=45133 RepID=A0A5N5DME9_9PEZI|nr:Acetylornithine deacetylase [Lasiodiplodia theobromae]KAB2578491.1 putative carboxypeptidase [Lasiodiplodia theobromae]KAF4538601.1 Acetylornithine deacetylase [Lasiodiplodia theobromae]KAF9640549.1 putative acetylornithine deacetylase protein [Lasiodiplodia theobromae]
MRVAAAIIPALLALAAPPSSAAQLPLQWSEQQQLSNPTPDGKAISADGNGHLLPLPTLHELLTLHREIVKIESISGNEYKVGWWLVSYLKENGFNVETQRVGVGEKGNTRFNVLAWPGEKKFTKLLVTSHIDTVPPYLPYSFDTKDDKIYGRGSVDAKGSLAAQVTAVISLLANSSSPLDPNDVSLLFVVGEETSGDGMRTFSDSPLNPLNYSAVLFGEPTENKLVSGHKGSMGFRVHVTGKAAHSGYPWLGVSANNILVKVLSRLIDLEAGTVEGAELPWSDKYGNSTLNVGTVFGGAAGNVVAETANSTIAVRLAGGSPSKVEREIEKALAPVIEEVEKAGGKVEFEYRNKGYGPVDMDCDVEGFDCIAVNYGTDVPWLKGDHKKYLYGPGSIFVAHSAHEAIAVRDLEQAVLDYQKLILGALKQ